MVAGWITTFSPWTWYWAKHRSQPFGSELQGLDKLLVWCESLPVQLVYLCQPPNVELSHFWHPWLGSILQHPSYQEEDPRSGLAVRAVAESWLSLNLPSLVVLGGKWLPFSQVGGIPMSEREPHWWCTNGVPNNVKRKWLPQIRWFIWFLARAFAPTMNDHIWSFHWQPLISSPWLPNWVTSLIKHLEPTFRQVAMCKCQPKVQRMYRSWRKKIVPLPTHRLGLQPRGCSLAALI